MISTDLPRERAAGAWPTPMASGQRGTVRGQPQGSSVLWTWRGSQCHPRTLGSPKCPQNGSRRASAWCTAGRWVRATSCCPHAQELFQVGMGCLGRAAGWCELMAALAATEGRGAASQGIAEPREALVGSSLVGEGLSTLQDTFPLSHLFPASKPKCRWTMDTKVLSAPAPAHHVPALALTPAMPLGACFEPLLAFLSSLASPLSLKLSHLLPQVFPTLSGGC